MNIIENIIVAFSLVVSIVVLKIISLFFLQKLCARGIHYSFYIKYLKELSTMKHISFKNRIIVSHSVDLVQHFLAF